MKKTLIALMALAGVAFGETITITEDCTMAKGGDLFAGAFDFYFEIPETPAVTGDYDLLLAYYQVTGGEYSTNAFKLTNEGVLTLERGMTLTLTDGTLTNDSALTIHNTSTFNAIDSSEAYTLTLPGIYKVDYLGGTNGSAAADLYLDGVKVASFTGGNHNMNGTQQASSNLYVKVNSSYVVAPVIPETPSIPEPATATLSLLALAGLAARRRRK